MIEHTGISVYVVEAGTFGCTLEDSQGLKMGLELKTKEYCLQLWHVMENRAIQP